MAVRVVCFLLPEHVQVRFNLKGKKKSLSFCACVHAMSYQHHFEYMIVYCSNTTLSIVSLSLKVLLQLPLRSVTKLQLVGQDMAPSCFPMFTSRYI